MAWRQRRNPGHRKASFLLRLAERIPRGWLVVIVFSGVVGSGLLFVRVVTAIAPPQLSAYEQCRRQCHPRFSTLENDRNYPMPTRGPDRKICKCS